MLRQDFIIRIIERAAAALRRAMGQQAEGEDNLALEQLQEAYLGLLRVDKHSFDNLDIKTLTSLLGPPEIVRTLARVMAIEARSLDRLDRAYLARQRRTRAVELYLAVGVGEQPEDLETLRELHSWLKASRGH